MVDSIAFRAGKTVHNAAPMGSDKDLVQKSPQTPGQVDAGRGATLPKLIRMANDLAAQGPPIDTARIAGIRQAIALGSYRVDPTRIANAILGFGSTAII